MAEIKKGILGGFSGKVGPVVGANWRGKDIIRSTPKSSSRPKTDKQILQQLKFKTTITFLHPLRNIQNRFFGTDAGAKSKVNLAASYFINNAIEIVDGLPAVIYNKVLITRGDLTGFQNVETQAATSGVINLTWEDNGLQGNALATDKVSVVCYFEAVSAFEIFEGVAFRSDAEASITLHSSYQGMEVQLYAFIANEAETQACNSVYLGAVTLG